MKTQFLPYLNLLISATGIWFHWTYGSLIAWMWKAAKKLPEDMGYHSHIFVVPGKLREMLILILVLNLAGGIIQFQVGTGSKRCWIAALTLNSVALAFSILISY
jgi:hypothetical protein